MCTVHSQCGIFWAVDFSVARGEILRPLEGRPILFLYFKEIRDILRPNSEASESIRSKYFLDRNNTIASMFPTHTVQYIPPIS
jgi:hypothetical protein